MKKKSEEMQVEITELREANIKLEDIINETPPKKDENVKRILMELTQQLQIELQVHRLPAQKNRTPGIKVKLANNEKKQEFIKQSRVKKLMIEDRNIYVGDHLMARAVGLLNEEKAMRS